MSMEKKRNDEADWELSEEFYRENTKTGLRLEDFIEEENADSGLEPGGSGTAVSAELERVAEQVRRVTELSGHGTDAASIAEQLAMEPELVRDILVCVQTFPEDDPLAVARLIVLG
ncbi:MAG: hypothetical protein Q4C73_01975 [Eubacteriales bacterium]|nr:hypothetical protein [Eubacteriales bacterium]